MTEGYNSKVDELNVSCQNAIPSLPSREGVVTISDCQSVTAV